MNRKQKPVAAWETGQTKGVSDTENNTSFLKEEKW